MSLAGAEPQASVAPERAGMAPLLSVRDVTVRFGGIVALESVSFDVHAGQIVGLIGRASCRERV